MSLLGAFLARKKGAQQRAFELDCCRRRLDDADRIRDHALTRLGESLKHARNGNGHVAKPKEGEACAS